MPIYTKTGDHGQTSLVGGQRVSKCCERLESYGTVDELNSYAGLLIGYCTEASDRQFLTQVQTQLFIVGGYLATDTSAMAPRQGNIVEPGMVAAIEAEIDRLQALLPPLTFHIARRMPGSGRGTHLPHGVPPCRALRAPSGRDRCRCGRARAGLRQPTERLFLRAGAQTQPRRRRQRHRLAQNTKIKYNNYHDGQQPGKTPFHIRFVLV